MGRIQLVSNLPQSSDLTYTNFWSMLKEKHRTDQTSIYCTF